METPLLNQHFKPDEINLLCSITLMQMQDEAREQVSNPYQGGMFKYFQDNLENDDPNLMRKAEDITKRYDAIPDDELALHWELIKKVMADMKK